MSSDPRIQVGFYLTGKEFNIKYVSEVLQVKETYFRTKEDWPDVIKQNQDLPDDLKPRTIWGLQTSREECYTVNFKMKEIVEKLGEKIEKINELCIELDLESALTVIIEMEVGNGPEMVLDREVVKFISEIGAEVDFDMYIDEKKFDGKKTFD